MPGRQASAFTAAQANAGSDLYSQNCSGCHGTDFQGSGDAPALAGDDFVLAWRAKRVSDLVTKIHDTMPPTSPGALSIADAANVAAYILEQNGARPGSRSLTSESVKAAPEIGAIANGRRPPASAQARGSGFGIVLGAGDSATHRPGSRIVPGVPYGVTAAGTVQNYVQVTASMLRNPPPGDWLMPAATTRPGATARSIGSTATM